MFRTALISLVVAAVVVPVAASAAVVYQHSPGLRDSLPSTAPATVYQHSPGLRDSLPSNAPLGFTAENSPSQNRISALNAGVSAAPVRFTSENGSSQNVVSFRNDEAQALQQGSGFDWNDAGVGALSGIGVLLVAGALFATIRRTPNRRIAL